MTMTTTEGLVHATGAFTAPPRRMGGPGGRVRAKIGTPASDLARLVGELGEAVEKLGRIVDAWASPPVRPPGVSE